jgi:endonuclease YncB( thermonuclease family)
LMTYSPLDSAPGCTRAEVLSPAGVDANAEQVRLGMAWVYVRYAPKNSPLYELESAARAQRVGLWAEPTPVPPWEWRRQGPQFAH